jgi:hypothetical protein
MMRRWFDRLGAAPTRRGFVLLAGALATGYFLVRMIEGAEFFGSFMEAAAIAFATMVLLATTHNLLSGDDVEEAEMAGARVRFGTARKAVGALARRVDAHTRATGQRLLDLEREVFKETTSGSNRQEKTVLPATRRTAPDGTRRMGERSGSSNGRPSPHERREQIVREDKKLKRDVDDALEEWDRLLEDDPPKRARTAAPERMRERA